MSEHASDELSFEQALVELECIVRELEDGQTGLEESLCRYEQGVGLLKRCYGQLRQAEQRILLLTGEDGDGQPVTRPFDHAATLDPLKPRRLDLKLGGMVPIVDLARSRRRGPPPGQARACRRPEGGWRTAGRGSRHLKVPERKR